MPVDAGDAANVLLIAPSRSGDARGFIDLLTITDLADRAHNLLVAARLDPCMPTRCAHCGDIAGRGRSLPVPGDWLAYLKGERGLSAPVGRLTMPLCPDCYRELDDLEDADQEAVHAALDEIELDQLVDEGA